MNTTLNLKFSKRAENNDLRDLSRSEYAEVNGGRACYKSPKGASNPLRFIPGGSNGAYIQEWNGRSYVTKWHQSGVKFGPYCKSRGHRFFF